jgi:hypothetical protein
MKKENLQIAYTKVIKSFPKEEESYPRIFARIDIDTYKWINQYNEDNNQTTSKTIKDALALFMKFKPISKGIVRDA